MNPVLLEKYNIPAPRYTSYPTVPYWDAAPPSAHDWVLSVKESLEESREISLYIHLPFCESLCTYCGCNKRITKNHAVEEPYIHAVLREWAMYRSVMDAKPILRELHLGGGTPTFFSGPELKRLLEGILNTVEVPVDHHFGVEAHPGTTNREQLELLASMGFNRLSIGIQDFAPEILEIINRRQSRKDVEQCTRWARELGFQSLNYDLIFGLPLQTPEHIHRTMDQIRELRPDRIAFYSYAHVPWIKPSQRAYSESDLPEGAEKRALYELGRRQLEESGYREIGLDHFDLPEDPLAKALEEGSLHRNFMGYTPFATPLCLALGASSIADSGKMFIQNEKAIEVYQDRISQNEFPILKGHSLSREDRVIRHHILNLMCRGGTSWALPERQHPALEAGLMRMEEFLKDGLIHRAPFELSLSPAGKPFVRNIALALDARYWTRQPEGKLFSQVV